MLFGYLILSVFLFTACTTEQNSLEEMEGYQGPFKELDDARILYSDSAKVRLMVEADAILEYENGDQEYPKGIYIEFYDPDGSISSVLSAKKAFYNKEENLYRAVDDVVLENEVKKQKLNTEELFWDPAEEQVYTEKFVVIETDDDVIHGEGLEANQDFSEWKILKVTGELELEEGVTPTTSSDEIN